MQSWICCQLGAREHYAVPRALKLGGLLEKFITDLWIRRAGRFHSELASARVVAPNISALTFELKASLARENGWNLIGRRNRRLEHIKVDVQIELLDLLRDGDEFGWQLMRLREPADSEFLQKQGFAGLGRPGI